MMKPAERIAAAYHDELERLTVALASRLPWSDLPARDRASMVAAFDALLAGGVIVEPQELHIDVVSEAAILGIPVPSTAAWTAADRLRWCLDSRETAIGLLAQHQANAEPRPYVHKASATQPSPPWVPGEQISVEPSPDTEPSPITEDDADLSPVVPLDAEGAETVLALLTADPPVDEAGATPLQALYDLGAEAWWHYNVPDDQPARVVPGEVAAGVWPIGSADEEPAVPAENDAVSELFTPWWHTPDDPAEPCARAPVQLAISTVDRVPQEIHAALDSMLSRCAYARAVGARLVVSGTSDAYLRARDLGAAPFTIETATPDAWADVPNNPKRRTLYNFVRILRGAHRDLPLVALQDDVAFASDWLERACAIAETIADRGEERFVLSLYASYRFKGKPYYGYNPLRFYGNQALYLPPTVHASLLAFIEGQLKQDCWRPDDMAVKEFLLESRLPLYCANPNLVQHVGAVSAIEQNFHQSPTFRED